MALALAGAVMDCSGGVARADNSSQLVTAMISRPGQTPFPDSISIGTLEATCPRYRPIPTLDFFSADGSPSGAAEQASASVWSLANVLRCLPKPILSFDSITIIGANGVPQLSENAQLHPADLSSPSAFANTSEVPFIDSDSTYTYYFRPWRGKTTGDSNLVDRVQGSGLQMQVFTGARIPLTTTASPSTTVPAGTTVTFTASDPNKESGLQYAWYVSGQQFATGARVQLPFSSPGSFPVYVQATDAAGGTGQGKVPITVTSNSPQPTQPGSSNPNPTGSPGSTGSGGTHAGKKPLTGTPTGKGKHGKTTTPGKPSPGKRSATHGKTTPSSSPRTPGSAAHASAPIKGPTRAAANGTTHPSLVSGRLIGNVTPVAPNLSPLVHLVPASLATAPALRRAGSPSILPALAAGLAIVVLLALGAGRELRWRGWSMLRFAN